jgi:hypothetical protein
MSGGAPFCSQSAIEQDPDRLMELIEINELLEEKEQRLKRKRTGETGRAAEG